MTGRIQRGPEASRGGVGRILARLRLLLDDLVVAARGVRTRPGYLVVATVTLALKSEQ